MTLISDNAAIARMIADFAIAEGHENAELLSTLPTNWVAGLYLDEAPFTEGRFHVEKFRERAIQFLEKTYEDSQTVEHHDRAKNAMFSLVRDFRIEQYQEEAIFDYIKANASASNQWELQMLNDEYYRSLGWIHIRKITDEERNPSDGWRNVSQMQLDSVLIAVQRYIYSMSFILSDEFKEETYGEPYDNLFKPYDLILDYLTL